ncbi:MAG TPA: DNA polymerase III subunit alpha [Nevskiaceae bacterium]|nr:DNA polymerase III subunit alpha [Nevskiaceae bacterium]
MFVHLHLHTEYSLRDGLIRIEKPAGKHGGRARALADEVVELKQPACAVTDRDNLFCWVKFYKAAEAAGVKPVAGTDLLVQGTDPNAPPELLTLLVQNEIGYHNLARLMSRAYVEGQGRGSPIYQRAWLEETNAGLIVLAGRESSIGRALLAGRAADARADLDTWREVLGDRLYLEVTRCQRPGDEDHLRAACALARASSTPMVATNDVRFLHREDFEAHEARVCIHQGRVLDDPRRPHDYTPEQYLKSSEEMAELFADLPDAIENSVEIARRCTLSMHFGTYHLPHYPMPAGESVIAHLRAKAWAGLEARLKQHPPCKPLEVYHERLEYELGIIEKMDFPGYFLVVADFINWSKGHGVPVGPGRGSGASSLVAYSIGITDLDPLPYDLLFERFLNPERVSMPDFDVDFCMAGRDRVIAYVADRYGRERVSQIVTYGTMAARAVVRDVARVLGYPYAVGDRIAKVIPGIPTFKKEAAHEGMSALEYALVQVPELKQLYDEDEEAHTVIDLGLQVEDITRGVGIHAGGVVIAPEALTDYAPLYCEASGAGLRTQFDMRDLEGIGLVKFDFLGLKTLTIVQAAVDTINARHSGLGLEILNIPRDDKATYTLLASGNTTAVFQMEGGGMQRASIDLQPERFEDVIALISLYRPGPMDLIPEYIARKRGKPPEYLHPDMEPVLRETYGIFIYQEQVMQVAQALAGYTLGGADLLRRAMGKKKASEMAKQRAVFVGGAGKNHIDEKTANAIFDLMEKFAGYGFNKSHAAAYALVSYQTAWLKAHYPAEFMAAVMSIEMAHTETVVVMLDESHRMGLKVLGPDVNHSAFRFTVPADGQIRYGLGAVKGAGEGAMEALVAEREAHGPFRDLFDFCRRVDTRKANKRVLEALVMAGALDDFAANRATLLVNLPLALKLADQATAGAAAGQTDFFGLATTATTTAGVDLEGQAAWSSQEKLRREKDVLGLYFSGHPITDYLGLIRAICGHDLRVAIDSMGSGEGPGGRGRQTMMVAGWLADIRSMGGARPGRILVFDDRGVQLHAWVDLGDWQRFQAVLHKDTLVFMSGEMRRSRREGHESEAWFSASQFVDLDGLYRTRASGLRVCWKGDAERVPELRELLSPLRAEAGVPVVVELEADGARAVFDLGADWRVRLDEHTVQSLETLVGRGCVQVSWRRWQAPPRREARRRYAEADA